MMGVKSLGKITDLTELAELYSRAKLGIAFSSTNPSLIPFEMLACGLPLIDIDLGYIGSDFEGCESILKCYPTPQLLAKKIINTMTSCDELDHLSAKAINWAKNRPTERQFANSALEAFGL